MSILLLYNIGTYYYTYSIDNYSNNGNILYEFDYITIIFCIKYNIVGAYI